jgi:hypothetical protein
MATFVAVSAALALVFSVTAGFRVAASWYDEQRVACMVILALVASAGLWYGRSPLSRVNLRIEAARADGICQHVDNLRKFSFLSL